MHCCCCSGLRLWLRLCRVELNLLVFVVCLIHASHRHHRCYLKVITRACYHWHWKFSLHRWFQLDQILLTLIRIRPQPLRSFSSSKFDYFVGIAFLGNRGFAAAVCSCPCGKWTGTLTAGRRRLRSASSVQVAESLFSAKVCQAAYWPVWRGPTNYY